MSFIELTDVDLVYGGAARDKSTQTLAVSSVTLAIEHGEFLAIVGPSGCGKSTLLKLISGLVRPSRGKVVVDGKEVTHPLKTVGMAFQNATLLPWRNIRDNVMLPLEIVEPYRSRQKVDREKNRERAEMLLEKVGLSGFGDRMAWQLSGGMQQRASLARALSFEPALLLMDEPFGALDEIVRDHLNEQLLRLWAQTRKTVVFVTHSIPEAVFLSSKIVVMSPRPGRIIDVIECNFSRDRTLEIRETPEFLKIAQRVRSGLRSGHSYDE
jgi:NitT/TauT family transport system ATP-binding protein